MYKYNILYIYMYIYMYKYIYLYIYIYIGTNVSEVTWQTAHEHVVEDIVQCYLFMNNKHH